MSEEGILRDGKTSDMLEINPSATETASPTPPKFG
jgi:hypothetical protein